MIKIRYGTFETNSSSMHSLVITKQDKIETKKEISEDLYIRDDGRLSIWDEEEITYGRYPFTILSTPKDRFLYLVAQYANVPSTRNKIINIFKKICPEIKKIEFPEEWGTGNTYYGNIDHQSDGFVVKYLKENNISFEDFIINDKYKIIIDGDEYCSWEKAKKSGLINTENIAVDINVYSKEQEIDEDLER